MRFGLLFLPVVTLLVLPGCISNSSKENENRDTPTTGEITIAADPAISPLVKEELKTFLLTYPEAKVNVDFIPENEAVKSLMDKKVRLAIIPRKLSDEEQDFFMQEQNPIQQIRIATDGVAFIVNRNNPDSSLLYQQVVDILSGKISHWDQFHSSASNHDSIVVVFDNRKSSTIHFIENGILGEKKLSPRAFAVDSEAMVRNYIEQNKSAIGVIDVNWISDKNEDSVQNFLRSIRVVAVSQRDSVKNPVFYLPTRYNMLYRKYPFLRDLYLILNEGHIGLGTGFANYVTGESGQLIIHHFGLVAAKQPIRVIELKNEF